MIGISNVSERDKNVDIPGIGVPISKMLLFRFFQWLWLPSHKKTQTPQKMIKLNPNQIEICIYASFLVLISKNIFFLEIF